MTEAVSNSNQTAPECGRQPSELYTLCFRHLPKHRKFEGDHGLLNVAAISEQIGVSRQKVFLWLKNNRIPAHRVLEMVNLDGSELTLDILKPYMSVGRRSPTRA